MANLSDYLRNRGLELDAASVEKGYDAVLADDNLLKEAAELWRGHENLIRKVLEARMNSIGYKIIHHAIPEEIMVLRQALVEVGAILDDLAKYAAEYERRKPKESSETASIPSAEQSQEGL